MIERLSPAEALRRLSLGYAYLDVRTPEEFAVGHPEGAYNVPSELVAAQGLVPNPDFEAVTLACFAPDARLVVGCASGVRSLLAAERLLARGFLYVVEQRAGSDGQRDAFGRVREPGWFACGLPSEQGPGGERSYGALRARLAAPGSTPSLKS